LGSESDAKPVVVSIANDEFPKIFQPQFRHTS